MVYGAIYYYWFNKDFGLKFRVGSRVGHETTEESRRTHLLKHCEYKDEGNRLNTLSDKKKYQASSQKFRQMVLFIYPICVTEE